MGLANLELVLAAGPWALIVLAVVYTVPRLIVAVMAIYKIPPDRLPAVLKELGDLFRSGVVASPQALIS
ncbi:hypothetical protein [Micromonospora sp. NBC_01638]|uniref:hypothetical protein n=1 Tax=Micromonospora sp. NBC_01638 TaxID=2975982 RepID=UPI00386BA069|nr:hypothetical protein OG811_04480 [Micromonospora sp. NBC_01638]